MKKSLKFQSAPLTDVRGDVFTLHSQNICPKFQSAPLTDVRGDLFVEVKGRATAVFQSAPLTDVRGDGIAQSPEFRPRRFNPLPSRM